MMFPFPDPPIRATPFAHGLADDFLDAGHYEALERSFPSCEANSGPTGYSLFRGDPGFEALLARREEWRLLDAQVQSLSFIRYMLDAFPTIFAEECAVDLSRATYSPRIESRREKELQSIPAAGPADALFVRMDILQGRVGYSREAHLDHRRRAATMLIYFSDQEADGIRGGELVMIGRGPKRATTTVPIRRNRMVMFPCYNESLHAVNLITRQERPRNFVQITVSSATDLWRPVRRPGLFSRGAGVPVRLAGALSRRLSRPRVRPVEPGPASG